jgi:hypothetical protein
MSNQAVSNANWAVDRTMNRAVNGAMDEVVDDLVDEEEAVGWTVEEAVCGAAGWAVRRVVVDAARTWPEHPALQDFLCFARRT